MEAQTITVTPRKARAALEEVWQVFMEGKRPHELGDVGKRGVYNTLLAAINEWDAMRQVQAESEPAAEGEPVPA